MAIVRMREMLAEARRGGYAVGYFEAWDQYSLEAVLDAAEERHSPVILGVGGMMMDLAWFERTGLPCLGALVRAFGDQASVPVSLLLNEVATMEHIRTGLRLGFNAVMLDTSALPFGENLRAVRAVVEAAHAAGADVEGEIDELPDESTPSGVPLQLTDPAAARRYVEETGVDVLSVAVGNVHVRVSGESAVDFGRLEALRRALDVPLAVHGGTSFPETAVARAVSLGVAKFNVGTVLKQRFLEGVADAVAALPGDPTGMDIQTFVGSRKSGDLFVAGRERMKREVARRMALYGSAGKAR